jgi:hypothetical protein
LKITHLYQLFADFLDDIFICKTPSLMVQIALEYQCGPLVVSYTSFMSLTKSVMKGA